MSTKLELQITLDSKGAVVGVQKLNSSLDGLEKQSGKTEKTHGSLIKQIAGGALVYGAVTKAARMFTNEVQAIARESINFEKKFANVTTLLDVSENVTNDMRNSILELAGPLGSATELTEGLYNALSAGVGPAEAVKFVGESAKFSKAALSGMYESVDVLTTVLNAYGLKTSEVTDVSNVLFQVIKDGKITGQELASSLGAVIPTASAMGVNIREVGAAIAIMTKSGISANSAVTALNQTLISALDPGAEAIKVAKSYGIELSKAGIEGAGGLQKWLSVLKEKVGDNTEAMSAMFPNVRALKAALSLAGKQSEEYSKEMAKMADLSGVVDEAFQKQEKTFGAVTEAVRNELSASLTERLLPAMQEATEWIYKNKDAIVEFATDAIENIGKAASVIVNSIGFIINAINEVVAVVKSVDPLVRSILDGWEKLLIVFGDELGETYDKLGAAIDRSNAQTNSSIKRFREIAQAAELSGEEIRALSSKYQDVNDVGVKHEKMLRDILNTHPELKRKMQESAAASSKGATEIDKLTKSTNTLTKAEKTLTETLEERWATMQKNIAQDEAYAAFVESKLGPAIDSHSDAWADNVDIVKAAEVEQAQYESTLGSTIPTIEKAADQTKKWSIDWQDANSVLEASRQMMDVVKQGLSDIGVELGPQAEAFMGAAEGAQMFVQGLINKNPLTVIAGGIKFLTGIVKAFAGDGIGEAIKRENEWMQLNKTLEKQLRDLAKQMKDTHAATSVLLDDIINEADVTVANFSTYVYRVNEILSDYDRHTLSLSKTQSEIGDSFVALITKAKTLGTEGSASILKLIDDLNNRGIKVKEIQDYINANWKAGLEGYKKYLEGDFSTATIGVFEYLLAYEKKVGANQVLVDGIAGITQALIGMSNVIELTEEEFDKFEMAGRDAYDKLITQNFTSKEALMQLQPMLSRMIYLQKEYGLAIDDATQALIDKAKKDGIDLSLVKSQDEVFGDMAGSLAELVDIFRNVFPIAIDQTTVAFRKLNDVANNFDPNSTYNPKRPDEEPAASGWEGWVARGSNKRFLTGEPGGEDEHVSIIPRSKYRGSDAAPSSGGAKTTINNFHLYNVITPENVAPAIRTAYINNTQGLRSLLEN